MKTASRARETRGYPSGHGSRISIDPDHHVTEAIGDMYGDLTDEGSQRQSYIQPSDAYHRSGQSRPSSLVFTPPASPSPNSGRSSRNTSRGPEQLPPNSPTFSIRAVSPAVNDAATQPFPLNDIDYESDPVAVAQEISNLQALRRMSMDVTSSADPDLPSFNSFVPSTPPEDGGDPGSVFWVPARLHPELAPKEFSAFLEAKKNEIRRPSRDGSLSPDGQSVGPGLRRKKSMLSRQIDDSEGARTYQDGAERLVRRRSGKQGPMLQIDDFMNDPSSLMRKLSVDSKRRSEEGDANDLPILPLAPPGRSLRRSTRTTYRRGSLKKGERSPFSKRAVRTSETDTEDSSPLSSPVVKGFKLERTQTEPAISTPKFSVTQDSDPRSGKPNRVSGGTSAAAISPSASFDDLLKNSASAPPSHVEGKQKSGSSKHKKRDSSPKGSSRTRNSEPNPSVPRIVEPPPQVDSDLQNYPDGHSSIDTAQKQKQPMRRQSADPPLVNEAGNYMALPTDPRDDKKERKRPESAGSAAGNGPTAGRKSSWGWLLGDSAEREREKEEKREKEREKEKEREERSKVRKEKRPKSADKHDNTRLDLLQKSIEMGNAGKVITADATGMKTDEKDHRKLKSEDKEKDKKDKDGSIFSFFGGSRKKSSGDTASSKTKSNPSSVSPDPPQQQQQQQQNYYWHRFPIHIERAIYRLSHLKLANPRRPLLQQVLLSNFMYSYLAKVQQTQPHLIQQATVNPSQQQLLLQQQQQQLQQQQAEQNQYYQYDDGGTEYVDDSQMYDYDEGSDSNRPHSQTSQYMAENGDGYYDNNPSDYGNGGGGGSRSPKHSHQHSASVGSNSVKGGSNSDDMW
ncbi:hypothetical protein RUND412_005768 [Rhizina undulata]